MKSLRNESLNLRLFISLFLTPLFLCLSLTAGHSQEKRELKAAVVVHKINDPMNAMKIISSNFSKQYSRQHEISKMETYRAVKANGKFIDLKAGKGFCLSRKFDPKSKYGRDFTFFFIDQYSSKSFTSDGTEILEPERISARYPLCYDNYMNFDISLVIKYMAYFSPLNSQYYKHFEYSFTKESGVIHFKSTESKIPKQCKLRCEGDLFYDLETMTVKRMTFTSFDSFVWVQSGSFAHSSSVIADFDYGNSPYLKSVLYMRKWDREATDKIRFLFPPTRRNPLKNNLEEYYFANFEAPEFYMNGNMQVLDHRTFQRRTDVDSVFNILSVYSMRHEFAPYTPELWNNISSSKVGEFPLAQALKELDLKCPMKDQVSRFLNYYPTNEDFKRLIAMGEGSYDKYLPNYDIFLSYYKEISQKMRELYNAK
jgi:hypothetical protein